MSAPGPGGDSINMRSASTRPPHYMEAMNVEGRRVQVIAIEDDDRYRAGLEALLEHSPEFELLRCFSSPTEALGELESAVSHNSSPGWQLVLMDLDLPGLSGIECTRRMKALAPGAQVVVLTVFEDRATILQAICAGADGYLLKRTPADRLLAQLRTVLAGGSPLSAGVARTVLEFVRLGEAGRLSSRSTVGSGTADHLQLTDRERDVLACLVDGKSYKACARHLDISIDTVRSHIRSVYGKLQVHSVAEAVGRALREHLV